VNDAVAIALKLSAADRRCFMHASAAGIFFTDGVFGEVNHGV
jgi:hypothetical protein